MQSGLFARARLYQIGLIVLYQADSIRHVKEKYKVATYTTTGTAPGIAGDAPYDGTLVGMFISNEY